MTTPGHDEAAIDRHAEHEYVTGQARQGFSALLESYQQRSDTLASRPDARLDIAYGRHPRQRFDLFPAGGGPLLVYFHAGYWQSRDKANFRFIAESLNRADLPVALANYPLCPEVSVAGLVDMARHALPAIVEASGARAMILAGHSAGAQIAVELAANCPAEGIDLRGILGISGVYDLRGLVRTSLNQRLRLTDETATQASPVLRAPAGMPAAVFVVGERETEEFRSLNRRMADAWRTAGNSCAEIVSAGADHFSILENLADPTHPVHAATLSLARGGLAKAS